MLTKLPVIWFIAFCLEWVCPPLVSASDNSSLEGAIAAYDQGSFSEAQDTLAELIQRHPGNGDLYYNFSISAFKNEKLGESVAAMLKAKSLKPRDKGLIENLEFLQTKVIHQIPGFADFDFSHHLSPWTRYASIKELAYVFALLLCVGLVLATLYVAKGNRKIYFNATLWLSALAIIVGSFLGLSVSQEKRWGAIVIKEAQAYSGPSENHTPLFRLQEGMPFVAEDTNREGWIKISLPDGKKAWIQPEAGRYF